jgi:hypothetical protein
VPRRGLGSEKEGFREGGLTGSVLGYEGDVADLTRLEVLQERLQMRGGNLRDPMDIEDYVYGTTSVTSLAREPARNRTRAAPKKKTRAAAFATARAGVFE